MRHPDPSTSLDSILRSGTLIKAVAGSLVITVLSMELGILQRILGTVSLESTVAGVHRRATPVIVVAEVRKSLHIRVTEVDAPAVAMSTPVPTPA